MAERKLQRYVRESGITASTIARIAGNVHASLDDTMNYDQAIATAVSTAFAIVDTVEARMDTEYDGLIEAFKE